jgi:D-alanyl-lipoteichoic acid acyltransferase DltB (MBOAT superfamily)
MLFNSYVFLFGFLPVTLIAFFALARIGPRYAAAWLTLASFAFYGWWNIHYVWLLALSVVFNYACGRAIVATNANRAVARRWLILGIAGDIALLGYYKYANFFVINVAALTGWQVTLQEIVLPLGISFFTFTQIAFLVDAWQGRVREYNPVHYALFVSYFPHLIAGPILHHAEMMPQFARPETYRVSAENLAVGLTIFAIGLFKKVMLADPIGAHARPVFDAAAAGLPVSTPQAWAGALAYTLQLYFDFSGYSDMAIGLSRLFGVKLPLNFHSPYKAQNITEFWRRWHMTLSRFLRNYLFIPLGGFRRSGKRRLAALMGTMFLGGLWHGAGWNFVVWGVAHGVLLAVNHAWRAFRQGRGQDLRQTTLPGRTVSVVITFTAVVATMVLFRAADLPSAWTLLKAMGGAGTGTAGVATPALLWIAGLLAIVWFAPNTQQIMARAEPALAVPPDTVWLSGLWRPNVVCALVTAVVLVVAIAHLHRHSEFLYFQF